MFKVWILWRNKTILTAIANIKLFLGADMRLLLVEDNITYQKILFDVISDRFPLLELEMANNAAHAKLLVNNFVPDIVFTDIRLNDDSGFDVLKYVKAQDANTIVAMLTSFDLDEYREFAKKIGADYFINKDTPVEDVLGFLADLLSPIDSDKRGLVSKSFNLKLPFSNTVGNI